MGRDFRRSTRGQQGARAAELRFVAGASSARVGERRPGSQPGAAVARAPERDGRRTSARPVKGRSHAGRRSRLLPASGEGPPAPRRRRLSCVDPGQCAIPTCLCLLMAP